MAVILTYMIIFSSFQVTTYDSFEEPYSPFHQGAQIDIPEDEIKLLPENIMLPANFDPSNLKNTVRDANDKRKRSDNDYSWKERTSDGVKDAYDFEQDMIDKTGGAEKRDSILTAVLDRKKLEEQELERSKVGDDIDKGGADNSAAGSVSLEFNLKNRNPEDLPKPTYMCGVGSSGRVTITIEVNQNGEVISASHDASKSSSNASYCMISQAEKFARKSRFSASGSAQNPQKGWIAYIFVSQ